MHTPIMVTPSPHRRSSMSEAVIGLLPPYGWAGHFGRFSFRSLAGLTVAFSRMDAASIISMTLIISAAVKWASMADSMAPFRDSTGVRDSIPLADSTPARDSTAERHGA